MKRTNINGITLVSLVITIIVLLILAGITINLMIGQDGIITRAVEAEKVQKIAEIKEQIGLELLDADTEARIRGEKLEEAQKQDIASKYGELQEDKDTLKLNDVDATVSLKEIWNGEIATTGSYTKNKERIEELEEQVEQLEKALEDTSKTESEKAQELADLKTELAKITVTEDRILKGYTAYKLDSGIITGTMEDNGTLSATLKAGESYTVPEGFAEGGIIKAIDLASQTVADATASDIAEGKTAWVNGELITGNKTGIETASKTLTAQFYADTNGSGRTVTLDFSSYFSEILGVRSLTMGTGFYGIQSISISGTKVTIRATHDGNEGYYPLGATVWGIPL